MKFLDLFSGIGGFRLGFEQQGFECVGFCEKDEFARKSYKAIHDTEGEIEWHDITRVSDDDIRRIGKVDIITAGFPCQAFSMAGKRLGFADTRGTLFFEAARVAAVLKPKYVVLENVKGLLSHDNGETFHTILRTLDELGYDAEWQVLNSKYWVPQNRDRIYIAGHLRGRGGRQIFPFGQGDGAPDTVSGQEIVTNTITTRTGTAQAGGCYVVKNKQSAQIGNISNSAAFGGNPQTGRVYSVEGISPTLTTMQGGQQEPKILHGFNKGGTHDIAPTLTTSGYQNNNFVETHTLRRLTPRECWRLQGFPDWAFERAQKVNSDSQLYKQAGNSVTVNVVREIAKRIKENEI